MMGKSYKRREEPLPRRGDKSNRRNTKGALKKVPVKFRGEEDPYNKVEIDYYEDGNFEKFTKRR